MTGTEICNICIELLEWWSKHTPFSYGTINVALFVIIQPAAICFFFIMAMFGVFAKKKNTKDIVAALSITVFLLLIILCAVLVSAPFIDIALQMKAESDF